MYVCMYGIKPRGIHLKCPDSYMNNNKLVFVENTKYLGVVICNDLKDDEDMIRHLRSFYARSNSIIRKCHNCSIGVKLHQFHAYCCTIYCSQFWVNFNKGTYIKLYILFLFSLTSEISLDFQCFLKITIYLCNLSVINSSQPSRITLRYF